eukprot:10576-Heterococcus_DN1.PRE.2
METTRVGSDSFDLLLAESDDKPTLRIGGSGDISMYQGGLTVYGESLITGKALQLEKGDVYMKDGNILVDKQLDAVVLACALPVQSLAAAATAIAGAVHSSRHCLCDRGKLCLCAALRLVLLLHIAAA